MLRRSRLLAGLGALLACGLAPMAVTGQDAGAEGAGLPAAAGAPPGLSTDPAQGFRTAPAAGAPGRRDDPPPAVPASPSGPGTGSEREVAREGTGAFECPRGQIARMLETAVEESEVSASMGLELELLVLCRDRWKVLRDIMESELALSEVLRGDHLAREEAAAALEERRALARARIEGARAGAAAAAQDAEERRLAREGGDPVGVVAAPDAEPREPYGWFTIIGAAGRLRAGVTDGAGRWMVGEGDRLPDGTRVTRISARPPKVAVAGGPPAGLPYRGRRR